MAIYGALEPATPAMFGVGGVGPIGGAWRGSVSAADQYGTVYPAPIPSVRNRQLTVMNLVAAFTVAFLDGENRSNVAASGHDADRKPATEAVCLANEVAKLAVALRVARSIALAVHYRSVKRRAGGAAAGRDMANLPCFTSTPSLDFSFPPANIGQILRVSIFPKNTSGRDCRTGCYAFAHIRRAGETLVVWPACQSTWRTPSFRFNWFAYIAYTPSRSFKP